MIKKKYFIFIALIIVLAVSLFTVPVFAKDACEIAGETDPLICGNPEGGDEEIELMDRTSNVLSVVYLWIGIISVIFIVIGGVRYMTAAGDSNKVQSAKRTITYSVVGLVVTLAAFAITNFFIDALNGQTPSDEPIARDGGDSTILGDKDRYKVRSISTIDKTTLLVGQEGNLHARVVPDYATDKTITYESSDPNIVTVDKSGNIKAKKPGTAKIIVSSPDGVKKEVAVTVTKKEFIPVTSITVSETTVDVKANKTKTVKATIKPARATDKTLIWKSNNTKVATVDQTGKIKGIKSGESTKVVVTARNKETIATANPNKMTLADAEVTKQLPKVQAVIKVNVESEYFACQPSTANQKFSGNLNIRSVTKKLIDPHTKDFDHTNFHSKLKKYGGYTKYVKSLGGIFEMYPGKNNKIKVKTACDFQAAAEYAYGLWMVYGPDYDNGGIYRYWGESVKDKSDAFYNGASNRHAGAGYATADIDTNLSGSKPIRTNCNYSCDAMVQKTNLHFRKWLCSYYSYEARIAKGGKITDTAKLKVGDIAHYFSGGGWVHVAVVGEVYKDYIVMYDGGGRFISTKQYKKKVPRGGSMLKGTTYSSYSSWYAYRIWDIDQSKTLEGLK